MELHPKIRDALLNINFVQRYEELSYRFRGERIPSEERLCYIDGEEVMEMIQAFGYSPSFHRKEKFFKTKDEPIGPFTFRVHIILRDGRAELVWVVSENGELLLGSPWGTYSRQLIDVNYRIKAPVFGTYEDLEEILKITFEMYEDFKRSVTS